PCFQVPSDKAGWRWGRREAKSKLQASGKADGDGFRCLAESRWKGPIDLAAGELQSNCRRQASVAAEGGDEWRGCAAVRCAALRQESMRRRRESMRPPWEGEEQPASVL
ncbi:unnamed protein product, partial [Urochloa humidicola]